MDSNVAPAITANVVNENENDASNRSQEDYEKEISCLRARANKWKKKALILETFDFCSNEKVIALEESVEMLEESRAVLMKENEELKQEMQKQKAQQQQQQSQHRRTASVSAPSSPKVYTPSMKRSATIEGIASTTNNNNNNENDDQKSPLATSSDDESNTLKALEEMRAKLEYANDAREMCEKENEEFKELYSQEEEARRRLAVELDDTKAIFEEQRAELEEKTTALEKEVANSKHLLEKEARNILQLEKERNLLTNELNSANSLLERERKECKTLSVAKFFLEKLNLSLEREKQDYKQAMEALTDKYNDLCDICSSESVSFKKELSSKSAEVEFLTERAQKLSAELLLLEEALQTQKGLNKRLQGEAPQFENQERSKREELEKTLKDEMDRRNSCESELNLLCSQISEFQTKIILLEKQVSETENLKTDYTNLEDKYTRTHVEIATNSKEMLLLKAEADHLRSELQELKEQTAQANNLIFEKEQSVLFTQNQLRVSQEEQDQLKKALVICEQQNQDLANELDRTKASLEVELDNLLWHEVAFTEAEAEIQQLKSNIDAKEEKLIEVQDQFYLLQGEVGRLTQLITTQEKEKQALDNELLRIKETLASTTLEFKQQIEQSQEELQEVIQAGNEVWAELETTKALLSEQTQNFSAKETALSNQLSSALREIVQVRNNVSVLEEQHSSITQQLEEAKEESRVVKVDLEKTKVLLSEKHQHLLAKAIKLSQTQAKVCDARNAFFEVDRILGSKVSELMQTHIELLSASNEMKKVQDSLMQARAECSEKSSQLQIKTGELLQTQAELSQAKSEIDRLSKSSFFKDCELQKMQNQLLLSQKESRRLKCDLANLEQESVSSEANLRNTLSDLCVQLELKTEQISLLEAEISAIRSSHTRSSNTNSKTNFSRIFMLLVIFLITSIISFFNFEDQEYDASGYPYPAPGFT